MPTRTQTTNIATTPAPAEPLATRAAPASHANGSGDSPPPEIVAPIAQIDAYMDSCTAEAGLPSNLTGAIRYSLLGPGKRLRPLLVWHACAAVGGAPTASLPAAAALELIHAFSLVHDDLPGIDNDDLRRGRPTLHRHTSEAMAILAGDAMLTLAIQVLVERIPDPVLAAALVRELTAATSAMIAGQVYDTLGGFPPAPGNQPLDPAAKLELVHHNKTGALIRAACRMGALSGLPAAALRTSDPALDALTRYGEAIGLMFQIVDDLLDVTQTTDHLGKRSGKDQEAGKLTYPGVLGIDASHREVERLHRDAIAALASLGPQAEPLRQLCSYLAIRSR